MINKRRLVKLTQKVISINSENPPGNEWELAQFIAKEMKQLGLSVSMPTFTRRRPNVIAVLKGRWPRAKARKEAILLSPHIDTVPTGKGWKQDPFKGKIINGRLYGRGATDDKGNLACAMEVIRSLVEDGVRLNKDIVFAATADEETGSHYGIIPLLKKNMLQAKHALILDSDEFDTIIAQKGLIHGRVKIFGKKAHGAYNWKGVNAIEVAAKVIAALKKLKLPHKKHPLLCPPTINIGTVIGGDKVNMVADYCEFSFDLRFLPGMSAVKILKKMEETIKRYALKFKIETDNVQQPYEMNPKHPVVQTYLKSAKKMNAKATLKGSEGATVITFFKEKKIPAFATGFGAHNTAHTTDEYVFVKHLVRGAKVLEQFIKDFGRL